MGRRRRWRRRHTPPTNMRATGGKAGLLFLFLFGFLEVVVPGLWPVPTGLVASDGGEPHAQMVVLADASIEARWTPVAFPKPAPGQQRPPCPTGTREGAEACWKRTDSDPPCAYYEVQDGDDCYMAVPERPKGPPVSGKP